MQQQSALTPAHTEQAAAHGEHDAHGHNPAASKENRKFAIWLFLSSESLLFAAFLAMTYVIRFGYQPTVGAAHRLLNIPLTSLSTFILLTSSFLVVRALAAAQAGDQKKLQRSVLLVFLLGVAFLGFQVYEFSHLGSEGLTLSSSPFGFAFFTLTGFHGIHVIIGCVWCFVVFNQSLAGKFTADEHFGVEFFGLYWHFVDVVWIFIFTVVYLLS